MFLILMTRRSSTLCSYKKRDYLLKITLLGKAIVIPPLITIQMQMANICSSWNIPYLNLSETQPLQIQEKIDSEDPKILLASIEDISNPTIQAQLQNTDVAYVALDEAQVCLVERE